MDSQELISTINKINEYGSPIKDRDAYSKKSSAKRTTAKTASEKNSRASAKTANRRKPVRAAGATTFSKAQSIALCVVCALIVAALSGIVGYRIWYNSFTDISLAEFTGITLEGYDKHGSAKLDIIGQSEYATFFRTVDAKLSATENLSNGDELTVSYTYDEEAAKENKLRIDDADAVITVEGLMEATVINKDMVFPG